MAKRQPLLRSADPIWLASIRQSVRYPRLRGDHVADVAIVGGGITAALVAERFARAGVSVAVLEAGRVGRGSTAASSALLLREPDRSLRTLSDLYGKASAVRVWQLCQEGVDDLVSTLRRLRIPCDLSLHDAIYFATTVEAGHGLAAELRRRRSDKLGGRWLSPAALHRAAGVTGHGAIRTTRHGQLNPHKACLGLFRAASRAGASVFERSRVKRIRHDSTGVQVETADGTVRATKVIIATGYATPYFRPLVGRFTMFRTYVLATPPLNATARRQAGLGAVMLWDTERPYHYVRWTRDHRLIFGGADRRILPGRRRDADFARAVGVLRDRLTTMLPALDTVTIEHAWEGLFAMTPDGLPYIGAHRRYPRHLFALGYGGNGMTFSALAARFLLEQWKGIRSTDHDLFSFGRQ